MILEAFSKELRLEENLDQTPEQVLFRWLTRILLWPPEPGDHIAHVIHTEITYMDCNGLPSFKGKSPTGHQLLESLFGFCRSYDHWQFSRWLHETRASDFNVG